MSCIQCGRDNCDGHWCESCGTNAESPIEVEGKFYCDKFCLHETDKAHPLLQGINPVEASIVSRMRALKKEADEAGVSWLK